MYIGYRYHPKNCHVWYILACVTGKMYNSQKCQVMFGTCPVAGILMQLSVCALQSIVDSIVKV